jgi:hypothetical protein
VERNGLIGAIGYYHILVIPHQPANEFIIRIALHSNFDAIYSAVTGQSQIARCHFSTIKEKAHSDRSCVSEFTSIVIIKT